MVFGSDKKKKQINEIIYEIKKKLEKTDFKEKIEKRKGQLDVK